ncbi:type II toxin-antitoxin system VapC family toxin [candidate division KSB1 bacterium]|nr:type II toxin-antitoxin system VapC family toxin [candidate division KSB1 bacterium]NIS24121.1 type II toxin-antitoxin system VapC family toxin [candidate division KSB1 bacterium]NIT71038.1 type II toxin-antitoxin system VapC family toxin [candidate division KSB1 bacterium]NIU24740.1 type II toxin-antitoxin system VapC family toxin [candidate division KSB1 bacterium]NIU90222.1 PIN domain-containing protein [candidate division KSB1 bacterium]
MKFMLDTNICIYVIKKKPRQVLDHFQKTKPGDVGISTITLSELMYGVEKSQRKRQNRLALLQFLATLEIVPYDALAAEHYGVIRSELERAGQPIGALDMLIAAHARSLNLTVVTNNVKEFSRVPALKIANWAS